MNNNFESRSIAIPTELIKALSIAGGDSIVVRFQDNRTVYCYLDEGEVVVAEDVFEPDEDIADEDETDCENEGFADEADEHFETCSECPHYCSVCGECTKDKFLR